MSIHASVVVFSLFLATSTWLSMIQAIPCQGTARYKFTFKADWTEQSHPRDFPTAHRPHFSPVVGCTHNPTYTMWKPGGYTTIGLRLVAEYGKLFSSNQRTLEYVLRLPTHFSSADDSYI